jgi:hypothetical protein
MDQRIEAFLADGLAIEGELRMPSAKPCALASPTAKPSFARRRLTGA